MLKNIDKKIEQAIREYYMSPIAYKNPACYIYDLSRVTENINHIVDYAPMQIQLYYAMKANNNDKIMQSICKNLQIAGVEIASAGELKKALEYVENKQIIYTGPGKNNYELECSIKNQIKLINIESVAEAHRINAIAKRERIRSVDILIRINLNYSIKEAHEHMSGHSTKMGIDQNIIGDALKEIMRLDRINVCGLHAFAASGVLDCKALIKCNEYIFEFVTKVEKENHLSFAIIDLGGGLGIDYTENKIEFDYKTYFSDLSELISKYHFQNKKILMELGTYLVGNAGYYAAEIIDIKSVKKKKHVIISGGINHSGLQLEMRRKHPCYILRRNKKKIYKGQPSVDKEIVDISGPLCMVTDKLCWNEYLESADVGDIVVFTQSGAYCYQEGMHDLLCHPLPAEIIV